MSNLQCQYCNTNFKNPGARAQHEKWCYQNPNKFTPQTYLCKFCGIECVGFDTLSKHEKHCVDNPDAYNGEYYHHKQNWKCQYCDEIFRNRKMLYAHQKNCVSRLSLPLDSLGRVINYEALRKAHQTTKIKYQNGEMVNPFKGKHHTEETKEKISKSTSQSRIKGYANGTITPAMGVGRGKYSYFIYRDQKYMLRSTYEFIYALYLADQGIAFDIEKIKVPAHTDNKYAKTFISDFSYDNNVIEIKGIKSDKDIFEKESFEFAGYKFVELYHNDIMNIKNELVAKGYDIDALLKNIIDGHNAKEYFVYHYDCL